MFRDTEQSYGDYTLDTFESEGGWVCEWWHRMKPGDNCGSVKSRKRKDAIREAKRQINLKEKGGKKCL